MLKAVLSASLLLALPAAAFDWNVPQLVAWAPVGDSMAVNGVPLKIYIARSKLKPADVMKHYAARFEEAGFYNPPKVRLPGLELPHMVALDTQTLWSYLIYVWPEPDGTTSMVLGASNQGVKRTRAASESPYPVFPGASHILVTDVELAKAISYSAPTTQPELLAFYRQVFAAAGWKEREPGVFTKAGRQLRLVSKPRAGKLEVALIEEADLTGSSAAP